MKLQKRRLHYRSSALPGDAKGHPPNQGMNIQQRSPGNVYVETEENVTVNGSPVNGIGDSFRDFPFHAIKNNMDRIHSNLYFGETIPPSRERIQLNFGAHRRGPITDAQTLLIAGSKDDEQWNIDVDGSWIKVMPNFGFQCRRVSVYVDPFGLDEGTYHGSITVSGATHFGRDIHVLLNVYDSDTIADSFGEILTPEDGASANGNVMVTGWALDDIQCTAVKIYCSPADKNDEDQLLGNAFFVPGARPEIEDAYPEYPMSHRAGWGFLVPTHVLPGCGEGDYRISAAAVDSLGNETVLGSRLIHCSNSLDRPFGVIEDPKVGGDVSGTEYINRAWTLTQKPNHIPKDGSTIKVWVNGVLLPGNPFYNVYREDVAIRFADCSNSEGAVGYYFIDTTEYQNGFHTIAWSVTDDKDNLACIGSQYFHIMNPASRVEGYPGALPVDDYVVSFSPVSVKKGYRPAVEPDILHPDESGVTTVVTDENLRLEIDLKWDAHVTRNDDSRDAYKYSGYHVYNEKYGRLPVGAYLDKTEGIFYWQPGPGFVGEYRLVFFRETSYNEMIKQTLKVVMEPAHK
ncbi:MAG: hypothetical protein GY765_00615 [bacterium]|nr:hypothetical protein [bacterium]